MGKTLDYDSVAKWMSLAVWADGRYWQWYHAHPPGERTDADYLTFFHSIAVEALNRSFSLRAGNRAFAFRNLLAAIAPDDERLLDAFFTIDQESWLTAPGAKRGKRNG